jgi:ubiquinone/menaquinone biosynthesis C-methylase UbiE
MDLHRRQRRQGPGGDRQTCLAIELAKLNRSWPLRIADLGCGTGASALVLARELDADVTAVDLIPEFLDELQERAVAEGVAHRIVTQHASLDDLTLQASSFDVIWSEGAVYNVGFEKGIRAWKRFLKPGGVLAVSELTWLTEERPEELKAHWAAEYPEVATASVKIGLLEANGYAPVGYFTLSEECWIDNYYRPLQQQFDEFLTRHNWSSEAKSIVAAEQAEIDLYKKFSANIGYGFYIATKI